MSSLKLLALIVAVWLVALVLVACGTAAETPKPTAAAGSPETLLQQRCGTSCHSLQRVTTAQKTLAEWENTVRRMVNKGAKLDDAEFATLVAYLAATYK